MSVSTRTETGRPARRVHDAEPVKSGAAQRAYARRRQRTGAPGAVPATAPRTELAGRGPFVAAILAMFGCGLALTLVLTTRAAEDSYQLSDAREANRVLADERAALQREVAAADSAPELATRARELGMIPAQDPARLVVAPDGTVTVVGEPEPAQGPPAPPLNGPPRGVAPRNGADPGERIVPVPAPPRSDSAAPSPGNVLAAPDSGTTPAPQTPEAAPVIGAPAPAAVPEGPAPLDGGASAPADGAAPTAVPAPVDGAAADPAPVDGGVPAPIDDAAPAPVDSVGVAPAPADAPAPVEAPGSLESTPIAPLPPGTAGEEMR